MFRFNLNVFFFLAMILGALVSMGSAKPQEIPHRSCGAYMASRVMSVCGPTKCDGAELRDFVAIGCSIGWSDLQIMEVCCPQ